MLEETLRPNFKDRNPLAYKFWNAILKLLIFLLIAGFGLLDLWSLVTHTGENYGLIVPFELLGALAGIIVILIYPALYFTLKFWLESHVQNFKGFKKGFYLVLFFPLYALLMCVVIFYLVTFLYSLL